MLDVRCGLPDWAGKTKSQLSPFLPLTREVALRRIFRRKDGGRDKSDVRAIGQGLALSEFRIQRSEVRTRSGGLPCPPKLSPTRTHAPAVMKANPHSGRGGTPCPPEGSWLTKPFPAIQYITKSEATPLPPLTRGLDWRARRAKTGGETSQNKASVTRRSPNGEKVLSLLDVRY